MAMPSPAARDRLPSQEGLRKVILRFVQEPQVHARYVPASGMDDDFLLLFRVTRKRAQLPSLNRMAVPACCRERRPDGARGARRLDTIAPKGPRATRIRLTTDRTKS